MSNPWGPPEGDPAAPDPGMTQPQPGGEPPPVYPQPTSGQPPYPPHHAQPGFGSNPGSHPGYAGQLYAQPGYGPPAYGPPGYGGYAPVSPETEQNAIVALVLAVLAWVICPIILAIVALVLAGNAQREIDASQGMKTGDGLVKASRILSWINIAVYGGIVVMSLLFLLVIVVAGVSSSSGY